MTHFKKTSQADFYELIDNSGLELDRELAWANVQECKKAGTTAHQGLTDANNKVGQLYKKWYDSLKTGTPDYSVYNDPYYVIDLWLCWCEYSRTAVRKMTNSGDNSKNLFGQNLVDYIGKVDTIVDLGCGYGFTSAYIREEFNATRVVGTNLEGTWQFDSAKKYGETHGFGVVGDISQASYLKYHIDVVFASEYFEHIERPIDHLHDILSYGPKWVITKNGFNGDAIGHFDEYKIGNEIVSGKLTSRKFNDTMREYGYRSLRKDSGAALYFNSWPNVWERH